jgi:hypothetical protein
MVSSHAILKFIIISFITQQAYTIRIVTIAKSGNLRIVNGWLDMHEPGFLLEEAVLTLLDHLKINYNMISLIPKPPNYDSSRLYNCPAPSYDKNCFVLNSPYCSPGKCCHASNYVGSFRTIIDDLNPSGDFIYNVSYYSRCDNQIGCLICSATTLMHIVKITSKPNCEVSNSYCVKGLIKQIKSPDHNGCGTEGNNALISGLFPEFISACNSHDICWSTCGTDVDCCDDEFLLLTSYTCDDFLCTIKRYGMFIIIKLFRDHYTETQLEYCKCTDNVIQQQMLMNTKISMSISDDPIINSIKNYNCGSYKDCIFKLKSDHGYINWDMINYNVDELLNSNCN